MKSVKEEQFEIAVCAMAQNIQAILMPLLIISYVFGLRIANLSINHARLWLNFLYMLIVWIIYYFLSMLLLIPNLCKLYSIEFYFCYLLELFITMMSIMFGIYYNEKFRNCLKKLDIIDKTLLKLGTVTDCDKLHTKILWIILGWSIIVILMNCSTALYLKIQYNYNILTAILFVFLLNYSFHNNAIGDLIIASVLGYIGIKFDQINEHLHNIIKNNTQYNNNRIQWAWENPMTHPQQRRFLKVLSSKWIIWTVIHLHLELHKISREIDSIFGIEMTLKMAYYFSWIVIDLQIIFSAILIDNYAKTMYAVLYVIWFFHNFLKFLLINYACEVTTIKAKATRNLINKLSYSSCDAELREIISQFSLQMAYVPLRFCGIGFFQFGFKFLYKFIMSIATVLVIVIQANMNK